MLLKSCFSCLGQRKNLQLGVKLLIQPTPVSILQIMEEGSWAPPNKGGQGGKRTGEKWVKTQPATPLGRDKRTRKSRHIEAGKKKKIPFNDTNFLES